MQNGTEREIENHREVDAAEINDLARQMLDEHHRLVNAWLEDQTDDNWASYEGLIEFMWILPAQNPEEAIRLYDAFATSDETIDRLAAASCLPALISIAPAAAFTLRSRLIEDEHESVRRNADLALDKAKAAGLLTINAEKLFGSVPLMWKYRTQKKA